MSYFDIRKRSPIEAFRNFIPCGVHSCKFSCIENSVICEICQKNFHYKCKCLSQKTYLRITKNKFSYICGKECYASILPFFDIDQIDIQNTFFDDNQHPCKKCKRNCVLGTVKGKKKKKVNGQTCRDKTCANCDILSLFYFQDISQKTVKCVGARLNSRTKKQ